MTGDVEDVKMNMEGCVPCTQFHREKEVDLDYLMGNVVWYCVCVYMETMQMVMVCVTMVMRSFVLCVLQYETGGKEMDASPYHPVSVDALS